MIRCSIAQTANDPNGRQISSPSGRQPPFPPSRLITFDVPASDQAEVQKHLMERYRRVFQEMAIPCDQERIRDIVSTHLSGPSGYRGSQRQAGLETRRLMKGFAFQAQISKILRERFERSRLRK